MAARIKSNHCFNDQKDGRSSYSLSPNLEGAATIAGIGVRLAAFAGCAGGNVNGFTGSCSNVFAPLSVNKDR